jgi:hypothetical protein
LSNWHLIEHDGCSAVASDSLAAYTELRHGVTTRQGDLNLSLRTGPDPNTVARNRACAAALFDSSTGDLIIPDQVHGATVAIVSRQPDASIHSSVPHADALVTDTPGILLGITIADCLPVFLYDPIHRAIGLAHSGWRGTAGRVVANTLEAMRSEYGTNPAEALAAIGPGICGRCYEVGDEVKAALMAVGADETAFSPSPNDRWMLDLKPIVIGQLRECGVPDSSVSVSPWCTVCHNHLFFSHRKEGPGAGRMGAFLKLQSESH